jgi:hypothetical protein
VPGFVVTGPGYGMILNEGAIFKNASGASSGAPVDISDSIRINNGGRYIHNTARAHAANIQSLSRAPGTEQGIFEFDIPLVSTTVSLSSQVFGKLVFASPVSGAVNYTASGTNRVLIRSDLELGNGVTIGLNLDDTVFVKKDFIQKTGTLNLSTAARQAVLNVSGNLNQLNGGIITESGTSSAEIVLSGSSLQNVSMKGVVSNSVAFKIDGPGGAILQDPLSLPYKLELKNGKIHTLSALLTMQAGCSIQADSTSNSSFIDGPVRKEGLASVEYFLFPVGKGENMRWLELKNATGNFLVEFIKADPKILSDQTDGILDHVSSVEYWTIQADILPAATATIELSFDNANSGGVTDLADLREARLQSGIWKDAGNSASSGTAGARGSVIGNAITDFNNAGMEFFTLASVSMQNPLPIDDIYFDIQVNRGDLLLKWTTPSEANHNFFYIQSSSDGIRFTDITYIKAITGKSNYSFTCPVINGRNYYRLRIVDNDQTTKYSKIILVRDIRSFELRAVSRPASDKIMIRLASQQTSKLQVSVIDILGRIIKQTNMIIREGEEEIYIDLPDHIPGVYFIQILNERKEKITVKIVI